MLRSFEMAFEHSAVLDFKDIQSGVEQFSMGHDDHIEADTHSTSSKNLSYQTLSAISLDSTTEFFRCGDAQARYFQSIGQDEEREVAATYPAAMLVYLLKLGAPPDPFTATEPARSRQTGFLVAADGKTLPTLGAASLQHQTPVFRVHSCQEPVDALAPAGVGLKRPFSLHSSLRLMEKC